jgi:hypothetical protein
MYYTGIDLHKKTSFLTTVDQKGKVVARANLTNGEADILDYFAALEEETTIVIESMASWYWLYDLLSAHTFKVVISNPLKTKAIASATIKNDKVDSRMVAQLLRADLIATVHVSSLKARTLKELLRHRRRTRSRLNPHEESHLHGPDEKQHRSPGQRPVLSQRDEVPQRDRSASLPPIPTEILSYPVRPAYQTDRTSEQTDSASGL